jgi:anti-sigma B factor antagonist
MRTTEGLFELERGGEALVVTPVGALEELDYQAIEAAAAEVLALLRQDETIKSVVLDLHRMDYCGSTALGLFVTLRRRVESRGGRMALCGLSEHGREILEVARLGQLWPVFSTRQEALRAVAAA